MVIKCFHFSLNSLEVLNAAFSSLDDCAVSLCKTVVHFSSFRVIFVLFVLFYYHAIITRSYSLNNLKVNSLMNYRNICLYYYAIYIHMYMRIIFNCKSSFSKNNVKKAFFGGVLIVC